MLNKKILVLSLGLILLLFLMLAIAGPAMAEYGLEETAKAASLDTYGKDLPKLIGNVIGAILSLVAVIFFALMIYGGFMWMTALGKDEQAKKALETIVAAVIGLIIILAAYAITQFVFGAVGSGGGGGKEPPKSCKTAAEDCEDGEDCTDGKCVKLGENGTSIYCYDPDTNDCYSESGDECITDTGEIKFTNMNDCLKKKDDNTEGE